MERERARTRTPLFPLGFAWAAPHAPRFYGNLRRLWVSRALVKKGNSRKWRPKTLFFP